MKVVYESFKEKLLRLVEAAEENDRKIAYVLLDEQEWEELRQFWTCELGMPWSDDDPPEVRRYCFGVRLIREKTFKEDYVFCRH